jgi:hypothetical protein
VAAKRTPPAVSLSSTSTQAVFAPTVRRLSVVAHERPVPRSIDLQDRVGSDRTRSRLDRDAAAAPGAEGFAKSNIRSYDRHMVFLIRRDSPHASAAWWHELRLYDSAAPAIIRELLRGPSVVADVIEVRQAVAWARAHPSWRDDDPPLLAHDKATAAGP